MGSAFSKISPSGAADGAINSVDGVTLDVTPELREQIKVLCTCCLSVTVVPFVLYSLASGGD